MHVNVAGLGNGKMDYDEFSQLVRSTRSTAGPMDDETALDLYDEALAASEELTGEESDCIDPRAFAAVAAKHGLLPPSRPAFVEPLAIAAEARAARESETLASIGRAATFSAHTRLIGGGKSTKKMGGRNSAPAAVDVKKALRLKQPEKTAEQTDALKASMRTNFLFRGLADARLERLVVAMKHVPVVAGQQVPERPEGDLPGRPHLLSLSPHPTLPTHVPQDAPPISHPRIPPTAPTR